MRSTFLTAVLRTAALAGAGVVLSAGVLSAADVYLQTQSASKTLPGGATVPMWVFVCDPGAASNPNCAAWASGARINAAAGDNLTIHLANTLPTPVSIVIPGQAGGGDPVKIMGGLSRERVRSFTHETLTGGANTYSFGPLSPGTYLYQSGTHPSIQVPMGLYGALVVHGPGHTTEAPVAYSGIGYDADALLLFSEIDAVQNAAVDAAAGNVANYPSTVDYNPTYFLINGETYNKTTPPAPLPAGVPGDSVLLRLLNAGLRSHTPAIVGLDMGLVAEDGNPYPGLTKQQSEALLPAGKTLDVLVAMPAANATYPLFDRLLNLTNDNQPDGGMLAYLQVGTGSAPPTPSTTYAVDDVYPVTEDMALVDAASVLGNDVGLAGATLAVVKGPSNGTLTLNSDGTFSYTPNLNFSGADGFTYSATLAGNTYPAQVTLNVSFANDPPVAAADGPYVNSIGGSIAVDAVNGVLGNDSDPDGDTITAVLEGGPVTLAADGSFTYSGGNTTFTYHAEDGLGGSSAPVTVTLTVNPASGIALNVQEPGGAPVTAYRWLVQEDATYHIDPATPPAHTDTLATNFHKSYMPVVAQGCVGVPAAPDSVDAPCNTETPFNQVALDPARHYYVSVLPNDAGTGTGHSVGGAPIPPGTASVTVIVNNQPIPTAQISVFVFEDISPTNGAPDPPEPGLGGFQIILEDAGGRYGISGGTISQDFFGNPVKNSLACAPASTAGVILTCPDGTALIKDLAPGKYGVIAVAPAGAVRWSQTSTIEGTKVQDTWVKAGEPPFLVEFGAPGYHAFIGFVNPDHTTVPGGDGTNTITGDVTMMHPERAPSALAFDSGSYDGLGHTRAWVGLNSIGGIGANIKTVQAEADGHFTMNGIPDGTYQLVIWDDYLDQIIHYQTVTVPGGGDVGHIPVPTWFGRHEHNVFLDDGCGDETGAGDGIRQPCERGLPDQNVNLRFRDGTVFQSYPTDTTGFVPFDQVFPFGAWQIAEIDYARFKPTGVTVTVDGGGDVTGGPYPGLLNPQVGSPRTDTENPPVLLEGFQSMPGMTSIFEWGKKPYEPGENGGISGIVFYAATRGENDPRLTVGDPWEPGIPGVKVRLYREVATSSGGKALSLVEEVESDSWDAAAPNITGCEGEAPGTTFVSPTLGGDRTRCFDGTRNFEQVRPGAVFDGGYAFTGIPPGKYVVEVLPPPGYELYKEEDKNVDFGDAFETLAPLSMMLPGGAMLTIAPDQAMVQAAMGPEPGLAQPPCVGPDHLVPPQLSLFPGVDTYAPFAGTMRPLCNRKQVILSDQGQAAADFHLFTSTPVAGQFYGLTSDDVAIETNPASPNYGDKWGPAFLPYSMRDFKGQEVYRGYTDAFGRYNGVVPSTFTASNPLPSGYSPAMHSVCLNDPGPLPGGGLDPLRNPSYGNLCYTLMYMPGTTTYLDTPLLPNAAFASGFNPVDCAFPDGTPVIRQVDGTLAGPLVAPGGTLSIRSQGDNIPVPNPAYEGPLGATAATITRNYGFGATAGSVTLNGTALTDVNWGTDLITGTVPDTPGAYQLVVTSADGKSSVNAVTVTIGPEDGTVRRVTPGPGAIQDAIDAAGPGDLILVAPGVYQELVVMWKPVRLQGSGAATMINAVKNPPEILDTWRQTVKGLIDDGLVDLLPGQPSEFNLVGPGLLGMELGAGITVLAKNDTSFTSNPSRIDGFTISDADGGGGIFVNGYAHNLEISNNNVTGNSGVIHGGIRIGHPSLPLVGDGPFFFNRNVNVHHNAITRNGGQGEQGVGGGLALCTGTENYTVSRNYICGNFSQGDGAGIGHLGRSSGLIQFNQILFNQTFNQGVNRSGGGILIAGELPAVGAGLTLGAGNVAVDANQIQGNQAGSGHGGGIRTQLVNGRDVELSPNQSNDWFGVTITNNMIVNNVAAWSGGGISLQDTAKGLIVNNTIANNDSTATVGGLVVGNVSTPQPAGISSDRHSPGLGAVLSASEFSDPALMNNIVWHNRAFTYDATVGSSHLEPILTPSTVGGCPGGANYWDLGVLGEPLASPTLKLNPTFSILTSTADYAGLNNLSGNPDFLSGYCNGARTLSAPGPMQVAAEVVEGGNFIEVRYGPLVQAWPAGNAPWNYHIGAASAGLNNGNNVGAPGHDFDNQARYQGTGVERGADEVMALVVPLPIMTVAPNPLAFNAVAINTYKTLTVTVSNGSAATASLMLAAPTITNGNVSGRFTIAGGSCGASLAPGSSCTINVTFAPLALTPLVQTSILNVNATNTTPVQVALTGRGVAPLYTITPLLGRNFGNQQVGTQSAPFQFTLNNNALTGAELWLTGDPTLSGPNAGQFQAAFRAGDTCTSSTHLAAGSSCTFSVLFAPTSPGCKGVPISSVCALANTTVNVPKASGTGLPAGVRGTGTRGTVAFSAATLGTLSNTNGRTLAFGNRNGNVTSTVTLTNSGSAPVTYGTATVANGIGTAFSKGATDTCSGATRNPGQTCQISVVFNGPPGNSSRTGSLSVPTGPVPNTATNNPAVLNLTGN